MVFGIYQLSVISRGLVQTGGVNPYSMSLKSTQVPKNVTVSCRKTVRYLGTVMVRMERPWPSLTTETVQSQIESVLLTLLGLTSGEKKFPSQCDTILQFLFYIERYI